MKFTKIFQYKKIKIISHIYHIDYELFYSIELSFKKMDRLQIELNKNYIPGIL